MQWFNETASKGARALPPLTRAGIAHLYFVSIHPFEDGNGRIGRAIAEKSLAQNLGHPTLIALAYTIERARKAYYDALERNNKDTGITDWLVYFGSTILDAQRNTIKRVDFYVARRNSMRNSAAHSMIARIRSLPACSGKALTASKAA